MLGNHKQTLSHTDDQTQRQPNKSEQCKLLGRTRSIEKTNPKNPICSKILITKGINHIFQFKLDVLNLRLTKEQSMRAWSA